MRLRRAVHGELIGFAIGLSDMEITHSDIAIFGLLVPQVENIIAGPEAIRFLQTQPFADARDHGKFDPRIGLQRLVLDLDVDQLRIPVTFGYCVTAIGLGNAKRDTLAQAG